jgi:xylulose-5-phosphate/fructose-6-phosphate phosphoketolase
MSDSKELESIRPCRPTRSIVNNTPLSEEDIKKYNGFFKANLYLSLRMICLRQNPLVREPLKKEHLNARLLGHFGSAPG